MTRDEAAGVFDCRQEQRRRVRYHPLAAAFRAIRDEHAAISQTASKRIELACFLMAKASFAHEAQMDRKSLRVFRAALERFERGGVDIFRHGAVVVVHSQAWSDKGGAISCAEVVRCPDGVVAIRLGDGPDAGQVFFQCCIAQAPGPPPLDDGGHVAVCDVAPGADPMPGGAEVTDKSGRFGAVLVSRLCAPLEAGAADGVEERVSHMASMRHTGAADGSVARGRAGGRAEASSPGGRADVQSEVLPA